MAGRRNCVSSFINYTLLRVVGWLVVSYKKKVVSGDDNIPEMTFDINNIGGLFVGLSTWTFFESVSILGWGIPAE